MQYTPAGGTLWIKADREKMQYKKHTTGDLSLITDELKRCADELASADVTLQTLRCMIAEMR